MNTTLEMPRLVGSRTGAADLASSLPMIATGMAVQIDASALRAGTASFADELIKQILIIRDAKLLAIQDSVPKFACQLHESAAARGVSERLAIDIKV